VSGKLRCAIKATPLVARGGPGGTMAFSHNNALLLIGPSIWNTDTGLKQADLISPGRTGWEPFAPSVAAFSHDSKLLAGNKQGPLNVHVWNATTGKEVAVFPDPKLKRTPRGFVAGLSFSPCGRFLYAQGLELYVWEIETRTELPAITGHLRAISADGKTLAVARKDGKLHLLDAATRAELVALPGPAFHVAFSPDGKTLATTTSSGQHSVSPAGFSEPAVVPRIRLWCTATGDQLAELPSADMNIFPLLFAADGRNLIAGRQVFQAAAWRP
jgi:WD40 repeat protein